MSSYGAHSDQDGFNPAARSALALDEVSVQGGGSHFADFEGGVDGWFLSPTRGARFPSPRLPDWYPPGIRGTIPGWRRGGEEPRRSPSETKSSRVRGPR